MFYKNICKLNDLTKFGCLLNNYKDRQINNEQSFGYKNWTNLSYRLLNACNWCFFWKKWRYNSLVLILKTSMVFASLFYNYK